MQIFYALLLVSVSLLAAFFLLKERGKLLMFRSLTLVFSISVLLMFNANWIFDFAIKDWTWVFLFAALFLSVFVFKKEKGGSFLEIEKSLKENRKSYAFAAVVLVSGFLFASSYFHWNLNVPRYSTSDSGTHFLYMNDTARNGVMSLFGKNLIEIASGDATIAPKHNETYFPGATAVFAFLDALVKPTNPAKMLQIFNIVCYVFLAGYFVFIFYARKIIKSKALLFLLGAVALLGPFFNLVATSHSTQLLGLLFLIAFIDTYQAYLEKKESWLPAGLFLGSMVATYFYWLPIALAFVGIKFLLDDFEGRNFLQKIQKFFAPVFVGFLFCFGYMVVMFRLNMFQYSSADGGVAFQDYLLSDALFVAPFAFLQIFALLFQVKRQKSENEKFTLAFAASVGVFALLLAILYKNGFLVSHYTAMKVLYLLVPTTWVLALIFFEENWKKMRVLAKDISKKIWNISNVFKIKFGIFFLAVFLLVFLTNKYDIGWKFLPLFGKNLQLILKNNTRPSLSQEQMELLDKIKKNHAELIDHEQLLVIGPTKNVLWAFAYSGIWPRTRSLVPENGKHEGIYSELSFYSNGIADYATWLKQDKEHVLAYFDTEESAEWIQKNMFEKDNYDVVEKRGANELLKIKKDTKVAYSLSWNNSEEKAEPMQLPLSMDFVSKENVLSGILLRLQIETRKDLQNGIVAELFEGECAGKQGKKEAEVLIDKNRLNKKGIKRTEKIVFDKFLTEVAGKKFCLLVKASDEATSKMVKIGKFEDGSFEINPIYAMIF